MFKFRLITSLFFLTSTLFNLLKWLFIPLGFLFALIIGFPVNRFNTTMAVKPAVKLIDERDLPDEVWMETAELKQQFDKLGFVSGQTVVVTNLVKNITCYVHSIVNHTNQVGLGFNCIVLTVGDKQELISSHVEFSGKCEEGFTVDLNNADDMDPFPTPNSRKRLFRPYDDGATLYTLFLALIEHTGCNIGTQHITELTSNLMGVVDAEHTELFQYFEKNGYLKQQGDEYQMTWKGAWISTWRNLWPTSNLFKKRRDNEVEALFKANGIDIQAHVEQHYESEDEPLNPSTFPDKINTITAALQQVKKHQQDERLLPYSVEFNLNENGHEVDRFTLYFRGLEKAPHRPYQWITEQCIAIDNIQMHSIIEDHEQFIVHMDDLGDGYASEKLIEPNILAIVKEPLEIIQQVSEPEQVDYLALSYSTEERELLIWQVYTYHEEHNYEIQIDAQSGREIARNDFIT